MRLAVQVGLFIIVSCRVSWC